MSGSEPECGSEISISSDSDTDTDPDTIRPKTEKKFYQKLQLTYAQATGKYFSPQK
jgi:hypothetical protein